MQAMVSSRQKKIDEREKQYEETNKISEEPLKLTLEAESKIIELKTEIQRLEAKLSDIESENQILKQQASTNSSAAETSVGLQNQTQPTDNDHPEQRSTPAKTFGAESIRKSHIERMNENVHTLINCVSQDLGFSSGKPVAAFTIYKCLLHWKSLEAEKTSVFDHLIKMVGAAIENEDKNHMAYWLSNTSILLFLLQRTLKPTDASQSAPTSFFGRMTQGFRSSCSANISFRGIEVQMVEGKYPALLFKQQLSAYVEIIYGIVRDNLRKDISPHLSSCIQGPTRSEGNDLQSSSTSRTAVQWQSITESLTGVLSILQEKCVPTVLCQKMFTQIFSYINVQLFNSLLQYRECCTLNNGKYVKAGLSELELWCTVEAKEEYAGSPWDELKHTIQVVGLLVIEDKSQMLYDEIRNDLCPILSLAQLYKVCTLCADEDSDTKSVSPDIILQLKEQMTEEDSKEAENNSFLLVENASIPFTADDISSSIKEKDFSDVKPAEQLLEDEDFQFLNE